MIEAILILSAVIIILGFICFFSIKSNIKKSGEIRILNEVIDDLESNGELVTKVETKKTDIRNEANETENDIDNSDNITHGVMPINGTKQSGNFRDTRGKGSSINS